MRHSQQMHILLQSADLRKTSRPRVRRGVALTEDSFLLFAPPRARSPLVAEITSALRAGHALRMQHPFADLEALILHGLVADYARVRRFIDVHLRFGLGVSLRVCFESLVEFTYVLEEAL